MEDIIINDNKLAIIIRNILEKNNKRDAKFGFLDYKKFTREELKTVDKLTIGCEGIVDISALKYCTNLKELTIFSANPKYSNTDLKDEARDNYLLKKNRIKDFSVINKLTNLESINISFEDNLEFLDVSNLHNLYSLGLTYNKNLNEVKGLENAKKLTELTLIANNIEKTFDLRKMIEEGELSEVNLDFDIYPILKQEDSKINNFLIEKKLQAGVECSWYENISGIGFNKISTMRIDKMDTKAKEILEDTIMHDYDNIEKICAIYTYIIQNVKYDYEALKAANYNEKNSAYMEAQMSGEGINKVLNRKQSSFNAILKGKSVCEGYTNMMHYLLKSVGVNSKVVSCSSNIDDIVVGSNSNHSVIRVEIDNNWYYFDPTWDAEQNVLKNFFKTKQEFSKNHLLSLTEEDIVSPEKRPYSKDYLTELLNKVVEDRGKKPKDEKEINNIDSKKIKGRKNMKYKLSSKSETNKKRFEERIEKYNKEYLKIQEEIKAIKADKSKSPEDRNMLALEKEIMQEEIYMHITENKQLIANLYIKEMKENLKRRLDKEEITSKEYTEQMSKVKKYEIMVEHKDSIELFDGESSILEMKLKLENIKRVRGKTPKEEANANIEKIEKEISQNDLDREDQCKWLQKEKLKFDQSNKHKEYKQMVKNGEMTSDELQQKLEEFRKEEPKDVYQIGEELTQMLDELTEKNLEPLEQTQAKENQNEISSDIIKESSKNINYEREVSSRGEENKVYKNRQQARNQNINESHFERIYSTTKEKDITFENENTLAEKYSRGLTGEKAELVKEFAKLEYNGMMEYEWEENPYSYGYYEYPKMLLQLEKVNGLKISGQPSEIEALNGEIYVATYETFYDGYLEPITEYYTKNEKGEMNKIGTATAGYTEFNIEGLAESHIENEQIVRGESIDKFTEKESADNWQKSNIEDALKNEQVNNVSVITDKKFLEDFLKQCGQEGFDIDWINDNVNFCIVETLNDKGQENFEIVVGTNNRFFNRIQDCYFTDEEIKAEIKPVEISKDTMFSVDGIVPGKYGAMQGEMVENKKEYVTKDGHRYAITKNKNGELGFEEIVKENEKEMESQNISTYSMLKDTYNNTQITQEEIEKAYDTINKTLDERNMQDQEKKNDFEGR